MKWVNYSKCLFVKAYPELDFKYFSNLYALSLFAKAQYQTGIYGRFVFEYFAKPELCSWILRFNSVVIPIYLELSFLLCRI